MSAISLRNQKRTRRSAGKVRLTQPSPDILPWKQQRKRASLNLLNVVQYFTRLRPEYVRRPQAPLGAEQIPAPLPHALDESPSRSSSSARDARDEGAKVAQDQLGELQVSAQAQTDLSRFK